MLFLWEIAHLLELTSLGARLQENLDISRLAPVKMCFLVFIKAALLKKKKLVLGALSSA